MIRVEPVTREWAEALAGGDALFSERFGVPVEPGWSGFPEALTLLVAAARGGEPGEWGPHLFFDEDGTLVGNGGWKGAPVDGVAELGYAVAPARQGRGIATAVVLELIRRARGANLRLVVAHTLAEESASTGVLRHCAFAKMAELVDPVDGPIWRWELRLEEDESGKLTLNLVAADKVDAVRELWLALHRHHRTVSNLQPLVDDGDSWFRRRRFYVERLEAGDAFLVLASRGRVSLGYALVLIEAGPDDTWPLEETYAELYSLSVAPGSRRKGIGTELLDFVDQELQRRGIHDLRVAVMVGNREAQQLYERRGFVMAEVVLYRLASGHPGAPRG